MKITDIEQKIKELKDMGCGKNGITKELELVLYEMVYDIMAGDSSSLRYEGGRHTYISKWVYRQRPIRFI